MWLAGAQYNFNLLIFSFFVQDIREWSGGDACRMSLDLELKAPVSADAAFAGAVFAEAVGHVRNLVLSFWKPDIF